MTAEDEAVGIDIASERKEVEGAQVCQIKTLQPEQDRHDAALGALERF